MEIKQALCGKCGKVFEYEVYNGIGFRYVCTPCQRENSGKIAKKSYIEKKNSLKILAIDVGKTGAMAKYENGKITSQIECNWGISRIEDYKHVLDCINPGTIIIICESFSQANALKSHNRTYGIIELAAEFKNVPVIYKFDNAMRREVLGEGMGRSKQNTIEHYKDKTDSEHIADCLLAIDYMLKMQK